MNPSDEEIGAAVRQLAQRLPVRAGELPRPDIPVRRPRVRRTWAIAGAAALTVAAVAATVVVIGGDSPGRLTSSTEPSTTGPTEPSITGPTTGPTNEATPPARPPAAALSGGLFVGPSVVAPSGDVVAVVFEQPGLTYGIGATLERWTGDGWEPVRHLLGSLPFWQEVPVAVGIGEDAAVRAIGVSAGGLVYQRIPAVDPGWYRIVTSNGDTNPPVDALLEVRDGAAPGRLSPQGGLTVFPALVDVGTSTVGVTKVGTGVSAMRVDVARVEGGELIGLESRGAPGGVVDVSDLTAGHYRLTLDGEDGDLFVRAPADPPAAPAAIEYETIGTVIDDGRPVLCVGAVLDLFPPRCAGASFDLVDWDWDAVDGEATAGDVSWVEGLLFTGTVDGDVFTVTRPPRPATDLDRDRFGEPLPTFDIPCPEPAGGWTAAAAAIPAGFDTLAAQAAMGAYSEAQADHGASWVASADGAGQGSLPPEVANDPRRLVFVATFTGDLDRHRADLAALWPGALCVSEAARSQTELLTIAEEVQTALGGDFVESRVDMADVSVATLLPRPDLQSQFDEVYGAGVVRLFARLRPAAG